MQAMNKAKEAMYGTLIASLVKTILLIILSLCKIGLYSLIISSVVNILIVTIHHYYYVRKCLR